jgi:hypothetical protein
VHVPWIDPHQYASVEIYAFDLVWNWGYEYAVVTLY